MSLYRSLQGIAAAALLCVAGAQAAPPGACHGANSPGGQAEVHRYPTSDEAFYVLSCMELNGRNAVGLQRCSCAVNALEKRLSYDQYTDASMVVALRQAGGRNGAIFRDTAPMKQIVADFVRAQKAANIECFPGGGKAFATADPVVSPDAGKSPALAVGTNRAEAKPR